MGYERKEIVGNAAETQLVGTIDDNDLTITLDDATNYPDGSGGRFVLALGWNTPTEEKVLCSDRTGAVVTIDTRGHDGTLAQAHGNGTPVAHVLDAETVDQANRYVNLQTTAGDLVVHNGSNAVRLATGASDDTKDGWVLQLRWAAGAKLVWDRLETMVVNAVAPLATGASRIWYDTTLRKFRPSNGAAWLIPTQILNYTGPTERDASLTDPDPGHVAYLTERGFIEIYVGGAWRPAGPAFFSTEAARDEYFEDATLLEGQYVSIASPNMAQVYRDARWVTIRDITTSASQPLTPQIGDVWLQPIE